METENQPAPTNNLKLILLISLPLVLILSLIVLFGINKQRKLRQYKEEEREKTVQESDKIPTESEGVTPEPIEVKVETPPELKAKMKEEEEAEITQIKKTLTYAPLNPTSATATCQSTGEEIVSGQPSNCPDPVFTWSGERTREEGTKIIGYWVYFGENNNTEALYYDREKAKTQDLKKVVRPILDGQYQVSNKFTPTNLEKDRTYYLAVAAKSDSEDNEYYLQYGLTDPDPENLKAKAAEILFTFVYR